MQFDREKYKVYTWKNFMFLHWIINPGLAINELILGQRVPKITLLDKQSEEEYFKRNLVPCPHCEKLHDGRTWSTQNGTAFKNWYGLYCPNCGGIIPCLRNLTSGILLLLTFPIWYWFNPALKRKWLSKQAARFENLDLESISNPYEKKKWIYQGFVFGFVMFVVMSMDRLFLEGDPFNLTRLFVEFIIWMFAGLGFGLTMKIFMKRKGKKKNTDRQYSGAE